jgi:hypothetical protein
MQKSNDDRITLTYFIKKERRSIGRFEKVDEDNKK